MSSWSVEINNGMHASSNVSPVFARFSSSKSKLNQIIDRENIDPKSIKTTSPLLKNKKLTPNSKKKSPNGKNKSLNGNGSIKSFLLNENVVKNSSTRNILTFNTSKKINNNNERITNDLNQSQTEMTPTTKMYNEILDLQSSSNYDNFEYRTLEVKEISTLLKEDNNNNNNNKYDFCEIKKTINNVDISYESPLKNSNPIYLNNSSVIDDNNNNINVSSPIKRSQISSLSPSPNTKINKLQVKNRQQDGMIMMLTGQVNKRKQLLLSALNQSTQLETNLIEKEELLNQLQQVVVTLQNDVRENHGENNLLKFQLEKSKQNNKSLEQALVVKNEIKPINIKVMKEIATCITPLSTPVKTKSIEFGTSPLLLKYPITPEKYELRQDFSNWLLHWKRSQIIFKDIININSNNLVNNFINDDDEIIDDFDKKILENQLLIQKRINERLESQMKIWVENQILLHKTLAISEINNQKIDCNDDSKILLVNNEEKVINKKVIEMSKSPNDNSSNNRDNQNTPVNITSNQILDQLNSNTTKLPSRYNTSIIKITNIEAINSVSLQSSSTPKDLLNSEVISSKKSSSITSTPRLFQALFTGFVSSPIPLVLHQNSNNNSPIESSNNKELLNNNNNNNDYENNQESSPMFQLKNKIIETNSDFNWDNFSDISDEKDISLLESTIISEEYDIKEKDNSTIISKNITSVLSNNSNKIISIEKKNISKNNSTPSTLIDKRSVKEIMRDAFRSDKISLGTSKPITPIISSSWSFNSPQDKVSNISIIKKDIECNNTNNNHDDSFLRSAWKDWMNTIPNNSNINETKLMTKNGVDASSIKRTLNRISKKQQYENENPSVSNIIANSKTTQLTSLSPASFREQMARLRIENSNIRGDISRFKVTMEKLRNECDNMNKSKYKPSNNQSNYL